MSEDTINRSLIDKIKTDALVFEVSGLGKAIELWRVEDIIRQHTAAQGDVVSSVAKAIADVIGHGMREKCELHAKAAVAAMGDMGCNTPHVGMDKGSTPGVAPSPAQTCEILDNAGFEQWAEKQRGLNIPDAYAAWNAALATRGSVSKDEIRDNQALITGLDTMAMTFAQWVERNGGDDDAHVITPPVWPTIGVLKAWICTLARAQRLLSEHEPVSVVHETPKSESNLKGSNVHD